MKTPKKGDGQKMERTTFKNCSKKNFTIITNFATKDKGLGPNERAMLWTMLSLPNDWTFSIENMMKEIDLGKNTVIKTLNNLREKNYLVRTQQKEGKLLVYNYFISDIPFGLTVDECENFLKDNKYKFNSNEPSEDYLALMEKSNYYIKNEFDNLQPKRSELDDILLELNTSVETHETIDEGVEISEPIIEIIEAPMKATKPKKRAYESTTVEKVEKPKKVKTNLMDLVTMYTDDIELREAFEGYLDMRKAKKKDPTEKALVMIFNKLDKIAYSTSEKAEILNRSTVNAWTDVYPLKEQQTQTQRKGNSISFMDI